MLPLEVPSGFESAVEYVSLLQVSVIVALPINGIKNGSLSRCLAEGVADAAMPCLVGTDVASYL